jgi:hypothetical protein
MHFFYFLFNFLKGLLGCIYTVLQTNNYYCCFISYSILLRLELEVYRLALLPVDGELSGVLYSGDGL